VVVKKTKQKSSSAFQKEVFFQYDELLTGFCYYKYIWFIFLPYLSINLIILSLEFCISMFINLYIARPIISFYSDLHLRFDSCY